jgi:2-keto-4-pentenoate hydratase/2-oxohepta-3-ene-1,7-dioic acid hydratase in catechol pathway
MDKIVCLGKNYLDHALELGDIVPEKPVIFIKPWSTLRAAVQHEEIELIIPQHAGSLHFETEIVLRLDRGGYKLDLKEAEKCLGAVTVGLDMTLRDLQTQQKKAGHPWTTSKVFIDSAIIGPWVRLSEFPNYL